MKTLDEAMKTIVVRAKLSEFRAAESAFRDMAERNVHLVQEMVENEEVRRFIKMMHEMLSDKIAAIYEGADPDEMDMRRVEAADLATESMLISCFANGVLIGMEMEKHEELAGGIAQSDQN